MKNFLKKLEEEAETCKRSSSSEIITIGNLLYSSVNSLEDAANWLKEELIRNPENAAAGATPFLNMFGWTLGGWVMCRSSLHASNNKNLNEKFCKDKINTFYFFAPHIYLLLHLC